LTEIVMERRLNGRLADFWALWTKPREMERWWGPNGFSVRIQAMDLRVGGQMHYVMVAEDPAMVDFLKQNGMPRETPHALTFTDVSPMTRLAWRSLVDFVQDQTPYETGQVIEFQQVGAQVHLRVLLERMHDDVWTERSRMGWEEELNKLPAMLEAI
jgi:uncharacterized protein YndB with AHSA1/START domain